MKKNILLLSVFALFFSFSHAETTTTPTLLPNTLIGRYLPENLEIKNLLTEPKIIPVPALVGKVTILFFWASWNKDSIYELYNINELAKTYSNMLNVYAITNERERTARAFLKDQSLNNVHIVVDDELSTLSKIFEHTRLPHAVVINPSLKIDAITHPKNIVGATVELSYYEQPSDLPEKKDEPLDINVIIEDLKRMDNQFAAIRLDAFNPKYLIRCKVPGSGMLLNRRVTYVNIGLKNIYQDLYKIPEVRTIVEAKNSEDYTAEDRDFDRHFCFDVVVPQGSERQLTDMAIKYLNHASKLKSSVQKRKMKVLLIKKLSNSVANALRSSQKPSVAMVESENKFETESISMSELALTLENLSGYNLPVFDETKMLDNYAISLEFKQEDKNPLESALNRIGLTLESSEKELEILVLKEEALANKK